MTRTRPVALTVNGRTTTFELAPTATLLHVLRNDLAQNGPKYGCGLGQCGACTVLIEGGVARACVIPALEVGGRAITTLEGLARDGRLHPVQQAFVDEAAAQCGYCLNGMIMATVALLATTPRPTADEIARALSHHLCRCGAHVEIVAAVQRAAASMATA